MRRLVTAVATLLALVACASAAAASSPGHQAHTTAAPTPTGAPYVFVIVLENESYQDSYVNNPNHYLGRTLQKQGTLLTQYHATGHYSLDNYISMISGQAPNNTTSGDCVKYENFNHTTKPATLNSAGQAVGNGCVYPTNVLTLADQLNTAGITWHGYMQNMGLQKGREQATCGVPHTDKQHYDDTQVATKHDMYAARHNPFVYFHSLINSGTCAANVVPYRKLHADLGSIATTSHFNFISPNLCNDGHDYGCARADVAGSKAGGLVSVDHFLKQIVPMIKASPAYQDNGLIMITSDESEIGDSTSCCHEKPGPSDKHPGVEGPGGGRNGALFIGRCISAGKKDATPYNHYSLLRSLEDMFGITTGGSDGLGHLGYAGAKGLKPFGSDVYSKCSYT
jgi:phosphatidylinositol-3-phosphatase